MIPLLTFAYLFQSVLTYSWSTYYLVDYTHPGNVALFTSNFAASSSGPNDIDLFVTGQDFDYAQGDTLGVYHRNYNGSHWTTWSPLGGIASSAPAAVSWGPGRIDVFMRGDYDSLQHIYWSNNVWSAWNTISGPALMGAPTVASWGPNRLDVFAKGPDNGVWTITWTGSSWSSWVSLGGSLDSNPTAVSWGQGRIDVFARSTAQQLIQLTYSNGAWGTWTNIAALDSTEHPYAASWGPNRIDIVAKAITQQLKHISYSGGVWSSWEIVQPNGGTTWDPAICADSTPAVHVLVLGDGYLQGTFQVDLS